MKCRAFDRGAEHCEKMLGVKAARAVLKKSVQNGQRADGISTISVLNRKKT